MNISSDVRNDKCNPDLSRVDSAMIYEMVLAMIHITLHMKNNVKSIINRIAITLNIRIHQMDFTDFITPVMVIQLIMTIVQINYCTDETYSFPILVKELSVIGLKTRRQEQLAINCQREVYFLHRTDKN